MASPIAFSITAEDVDTLSRALAVAKDDVLLCIGSSGDTPLGLLTHDVARIDVVDASFGQIALATLKATAMRELSLSEYRTLLGVTPNPHLARSLYQRVSPRLPADVAAFWREHQHMFERGLLWQGGLARQIALARRALGVVLGRAWLDRLARSETREEANAALEEVFSSRRAKALLWLALSPWVRGRLVPAETLRHLAPNETAHEFFLRHARGLLVDRPLATNPYIFPLAFGRYASLQAVPPHLSEAHYEVIRSRVDRLRFIHLELGAHLRRTPRATYHGLALCNVIDWMSPSDIEQLLVDLSSAGRPGARAVMFSRSKEVTIPDRLSARLSRDRELGARLLTEDRTGYHHALNIVCVQ